MYRTGRAPSRVVSFLCAPLFPCFNVMLRVNQDEGNGACISRWRAWAHGQKQSTVDVHVHVTCIPHSPRSHFLYEIRDTGITKLLCRGYVVHMCVPIRERQDDVDKIFTNARILYKRMQLSICSYLRRQV